MKPNLCYIPKSKCFYLLKDCPALGFFIVRNGRNGEHYGGIIFEYDKSCRKFIPKDVFGLKIATRLYGYSTQQMILLQLMGIVEFYEK